MFVEYDLTAEDFLFLICFFKDDYDSLREYIKHFKVTPEVIISLVQRGFLETIDVSKGMKFSNFKITKKFVDIIQISEEDAFEELYALYPTSTTNGRKLKGAKEQCKEKYKRIVGGDKIKHQQVISALEAEIRHRVQTSQTDFQQMLITWLNQKTWELYADERSKTSSTNELL